MSRLAKHENAETSDAPNDGRNADGPVVAPTLALTSKLNSDATGMRYQWGRKDPFTYATSSEKGGGGTYQYGKYSVKIYTIDGVLIYQAENGDDNSAKSPKGGVIVQSSVASSMMATIANPITFYGSGAVINQARHGGDLYNYYWTSYSRGTDGRVNTTTWISEPNWHNGYLDGYIPLRVKSIYDPCPYLYRIHSNGTWNQFTNPGWAGYTYLGGASWNMATLGESWLSGSGRRDAGLSVFAETGRWGFYFQSTSSGQTTGYGLGFNASKEIYSNWSDARSLGFTVRCIEGFNVTFRTGISATVQHSPCKHDYAIT